ncbi:hypothetical protein EJ06DRAFT_555845 [Trichodelitschia bisporula]|uniref:HMG box domain-containing protein n=1 Tax=Trichodelitschia bisporula TaxID=703511 RepID=A0A6G1HZF4_9PEZI|nr:hypothetical protein EJ06DRAFT_555845 [Trichodelitschia bisporula]
MEHEPFVAHLGPYSESHYPEPSQAMGLGIQYAYDQGQHSQHQQHQFQQHQLQQHQQHQQHQQQQQPYYPADGHLSHSGSPYMQPHGLPLTSPPTPLSTVSEGRRQTRSNRSNTRTNSPHGSVRKTTPPRIAKKKGAKADKTKTPKLTAPLSVLTKDMNHVPVRDMEAWVNRSVEERIKEAERRNGYITRPMNSFMLYRSAYAERTKVWCLHNNHQVVSSVSGESWPLEPPQVREFYNDLAKVERINHQNAHPHYKFSPSKPGVASRKRKGTDSDEDSLEPSDLDDPDAEWGASHGRRNRGSKRPGRDAGYPARSVQANPRPPPLDAQFGPNDGYNKSSWEASNGGRPLPVPMGHAMPQAHGFFGHHPHHGHLMSAVEDVRFGQLDHGGYTSNPALIGLPGASHHELLQLHSASTTPGPFEMGQVDPTLLAYDEGHFAAAMEVGGMGGGEGGGYPVQSQQQGQGQVSDGAFDLDRQLVMQHEREQAALGVYPSTGLVTDYTTKTWQPESTSPTFEQPSDFDKYWDEEVMMQQMDRKLSGDRN